MPKITPMAHPSKITIPAVCHPIARIVLSEMARQRATYDEMEHVSGVLRSTIKMWRKCARPGLASLEATLGALGWTIEAIPFAEAIPSELRDDLERLVDRGAHLLPCLAYLKPATQRRPRSTAGYDSPSEINSA